MQFVWTLTLTLILHSYLFLRKEHNKKQLNMMSHKNKYHLGLRI